MSRSRRVTALAVVAAGGGGLFFLASGEEQAAEAGRTAPVETIARRVEALRGRSFNGTPKVEKVDERDLRRDAAEAQRELTPAQERELEGGQEALKMLGFIPGDVTQDDLQQASTNAIAGFYDFRDKRLALVSGVPEGPQAEVTIAHELGHALEDRHFRIRPPGPSAGDDPALARLALQEGSATFLEQRYSREHLDGRAAAPLPNQRPRSTIRQPGGPGAYLENQVVYAYLDGARFVEALYRETGDWTLVDRALADKPPTSTEQVLHPEKYLSGDQPRSIRVRAMPKGFTRLAAGSFGEFDTSQLALFGARADDDVARTEARTAAAGWDGGRYELWRAGGRDRRGCGASPCLERNVLIVGWRMDTVEDRRELEELLPSYLEAFQRLRRTGERSWEAKGVAAALNARGKRVTIAIAPTPEIAAMAVS